ncbi:MAG: saccharopine dehydrogenase NADP-binding domain-containing protein [Hydrogenibacillus sp.]|nr:saccharopine dehydrogenase NADP-binding domain-containing protein [Hydrogenibacillus sp.]
MRYIVLGAGLMGRVAARALLEGDASAAVTLTDIDGERLNAFVQQYGRLFADRLATRVLDARDAAALDAALAGHDVAINALYYTFNEPVARASFARGVHYVDLGGHIMGITRNILGLHEEAVKRGVTLIPDLGVAPGMINILTGYGASLLHRVRHIRLYVGGIPRQPEPPLGYAHVFSLEGLFDHYSDPAEIIRGGRRVVVPALSEVETVYFPQFGPLEAFHTAGGTSTLIDTFQDVESLEYKTVRYPGHAEKMRFLAELGLLDRERVVDVGGAHIRPRDCLLRLLEPRLALGERDDAVVLRVSLEGEWNGVPAEVHFESVTFKDRARGVTAMAQMTAYSIVAVAEMLAQGKITTAGAYPPERIVPGAEYIAAMKTRGVHIEAEARDGAGRPLPDSFWERKEGAAAGTRKGHVAT